MPSMEAPAAPDEPKLQKIEPVAQNAAPRPKFENPYLAHQTTLMFEAFARDNPDLALDLETPGQRDAVAMWWVGKGYAAAFAHAAARLRESGDDRLLPELEDLELDSEDEERDIMSLAIHRFGKPLR